MYNIFVIDSSKNIYYYLNKYFFANNDYNVNLISPNDPDNPDDPIDIINCSENILKKYFENKIKKSDLNIIINCEELNDKNLENIKNVENYYKINSNFPLIISNYSKSNDIKFIHLTNDSVYLGTTGNYDEDSFNDSQTNYSLSKTIGEKSNGTIIRVCLLGDEKESNKNNFLGWLKINKNNEIYVEDNHYLNCITYLEFCKLIEKIIGENLFWNGIRHIYSPKQISKFELANLINDIYQLNLKINKLQTEKIDRTLNTKYDNNYNISDLDKQLIELKQFELSPYNKQKISIVMAYYNRKPQILNTLDGFEKQYAGKYNFEVIIVDDNSNQENKLDVDIKKYTFPINLIVINAEEKGDRINPCLAYNKGFEQTTGEIVIIQNPECYHVGNIILHTISNLKETEYYSYSCFTANTEEITNRMLNSNNIFELIKNKDFLEENFKYIDLNWYNHPTEPGRNVAYHFCSAIYKNKLELIGGFDKRFAQGYCFDDDEFLLSIKYNLKLKINIIDTEKCFVIHQYHKRNDSFNCENKQDDDFIKSKWLKNKNLFEKIKYEHEKNDFIYPKLIFLYWDGSPLSYLNYLTVESFNYYNKEWKIIVFTPTIRTTTISWKTNEQKIKYTGKDYFYKLYDVDNLVVLKIDLDKIGFYNDASEVIKSDYFRYYILEKHGGLWSDFDIIYTGSIEEKMNFKENTVIFQCKNYSNPNDTINGHFEIYYPIGLFLTKCNTVFFKFILSKVKMFYDKNNYQCLGANMFIKLFKHSKIRCMCGNIWCSGHQQYYIDKNDLEIFDDLKICNDEYYLPIPWNNLDKLFNSDEIIKLSTNNVGIHWFNGADKTKEYINNTLTNIKNFKINVAIDNLINKFVVFDLIIFYCGQFNKLKMFIDNLKKNYVDNKIILHIICNKNDKEKIQNNMNLELDVKFNENIENEIKLINNDYIFFQDMICHHNSNIFVFLKQNIKQEYDFIGITKMIENNRLSNEYKNKIYKYKFPDIILFNKHSFIKNNILFNDDWHKYNHKIFKSTNINYMFPSKIPKIVHLYWDNNKFDYLTNLSLKSLVFNNPDWEINLWLSQIPNENAIIWEKNEFIPPHTFKYDDYNYFNIDVLNELGIIIKNIEYFDLDLKNNIHEVLKSDIFRWKILYEIGGVWSDMDILFVDRIEKTDFDKLNCEFLDIDFVVSQYQMNIEGLLNPLDFYYIGFLMGSKNNEFYKIMYNESHKNIDNTSYQNVGGDLMKKYFGLYYDIVNKLSTSKNYCNLNSNSVYHYWWKDLKNMFITNNQKNSYKYLFQNNNIIGYHWFRGVHLSKIYTHFMNHENKIHNYELFDGPINYWCKYYNDIFNDFILNKINKKISIVMGYTNRLNQLIITLKTIEKSKHQNYEIIIVNDDNENIDFLKNQFKNLMIINNYHQKYTNPCMTYNLGIKHATGEIILLQNPECCHIGDLLTIVNTILKPNDYMSFCAFHLNNYSKNSKIVEILFDDNDGDNFWNPSKIKNLYNYINDISTSGVLQKKHNSWCSHHFYNPNHLHFCCAIYKNDLINIGCFTEDYAHGICFDDDDLIRKIYLNKLNNYYFYIPQYANSYPSLSEFTAFVIHQHHEHFDYGENDVMIKWNLNKKIFTSTNFHYIKKFIEINELFKYYNLKITNGKIIKYNSKNEYNIHFDNKNNNIIIVPTINHFFEYIFNGGSLKIKNDLQELYNMCLFEILIENYDGNQIEINNKIVKKINNSFIHKTKLLNFSIVISNCNINTNIKFNIKLIDSQINDNTQLLELQ